MAREQQMRIMTSRSDPEEGFGTPSGTDDSSDSDLEEYTLETFPEDIYGMACATVIRDVHRISKNEGSKYASLRVFRIALTLLVLLANIGLQAFLIVEVKLYVSASAVRSIRDSYEKFEEVMYGNHTWKTPNTGRTRGTDIQYFVHDNFKNKLTEEEQESVCLIPFVHPHYFAVVLLVWTLTLMAELRQCANLFYRLVLMMPRTRRIGDTIKDSPGVQGEEIVVKLTIGVKLTISFFVLLPRFLIAVVLLWLGCRWLTATTSMEELILNAVALEFIILLKDLLYNALVPGRNQRDTLSTKIDVSSYEHGAPSPASFLSAFLLGALAIVFVFFYINYWQHVLPHYNWDVHEVCVEWSKKKFHLKSAFSFF